MRNLTTQTLITTWEMRTTCQVSTQNDKAYRQATRYEQICGIATILKAF